MRKLSFKKGLYRYYSPILFKLYKLKACIDLFRWQIPISNLNALSKTYWSEYIRRRTVKEAPLFGCLKMEQGQNPLCTGDTAYILGCSQSINKVTKSEWLKIGKHFSIGLNFFYTHEFTPKVYFSEFVSYPEFVNFYHQRVINRNENSDFQIYIPAGYISKCPVDILTIHNRVPYFYPTVSVKLSNKQLLRHVISKFYLGHNENAIISHQISNLDSAINYCVNQGIKHIKLVGVDLKDESYFFENSGDLIYQQASDVIDEIRDRSRHKSILRTKHATAAPEIAKELGNLTITEYLPFLQKEILTPLGVTLSVTNPDSLLADKINLTSI